MIVTTSNEPRIRRHSPFVAALRTPLAGVWVGIRFLLIPLLWLRYRTGSRMDWAFSVDAFMKRSLYPLTETPDDALKRDLELPASVQSRYDIADPADGETDAAPPPRSENGWASLGHHPIDLARFANGRPLLLILYRGNWCPYSRLHLADLSTVAHRLETLGVAVLAVSARRHDDWWRAKGISLAFAADPDGDLFHAMGVRIAPPLSHRVWGMLLPHESGFLFDRHGNLVAADVRRLNPTKTKQTFLSATRWLALAHELADAERIARHNF
ncbi:MULTISPECIES: redoxin domain-containing protein [Burkholderia]|uniref:Redoxin family protein n=1 Tax=Burkholderia mayonis TaxID=1385591 RepID=A0A1B4FP61_9BURK|nr:MULTISPECIES: redoxin domain-containing protein [Burkholderia]AOJ05453.1 redoxin family protein [Burkholderia mayonis]KVE41008.1 redoxin family protein [Burkholderia sp. BDU5]KVE47833.1 redoxin family protein [Burkholderia mayonis]